MGVAQEKVGNASAPPSRLVCPLAAAPFLAAAAAVAAVSLSLLPSALKVALQPLLAAIACGAPVPLTDAEGMCAGGPALAAEDAVAAAAAIEAAATAVEDATITAAAACCEAEEKLAVPEAGWSAADWAEAADAD